MLEIKNTKVYDLKESIISCRNAMRLDIPEYTEEEFQKGFERAKKLVRASKNSPNIKCHDNFMTGIRVSFDLKYTQYITKQFQRYHWFDYVSSSSLMHRLTMMDPEKMCNEYVSSGAVWRLNKDIEIYNNIANSDDKHFPGFTIILRDGTIKTTKSKAEALYWAYMRCISDCPMGVELFVHVSTNYKQIQTIYFQRKGHKLKEDWGAFEKWVETLPYAHELIIGDADETNNSH